MIKHSAFAAHALRNTLYLQIKSGILHAGIVAMRNLISN
jgi:hypothetical protein